MIVTPSLILLILSFRISVLILFYFILFTNLCVNNIFPKLKAWASYAGLPATDTLKLTHHPLEDVRLPDSQQSTNGKEEQNRSLCLCFFYASNNRCVFNNK